MKRIIFIVFTLFILLSVPTQAQGTLIYLPLILKSQEYNMENGWSFIQPVESTNYVLNPSAEAASNYASLAGSTITRSSTYQKYGRYSYRVQTGSNGQGLSLTLSTLTNSFHYVTARIRGQLPNDLRFIIGTGLKTPVLIEKIDDDWSLYGVQFNASETNGRTELRIIQQGNGIGDFYVDGIQVEPLAYWTTYIDGTQEGCAWNGTENASTSTRSGLSLAGGQVKDFYDDYGFLVEKVVGAGSPPQSVNIDDYAILPGGELNSIKVQPRDMSIVGKFIADNELELHDKQQALHLALSSENYPGNQSFKLRFNGARVQKEIKVNYKGGLEGELNAFYCDKVVSGDSDWESLYKWIEKASIQLQAPDPYWYETGESAANLDTNDSATFRLVAGRLKSTGQWSNLGPPTLGGTYTSVLAIAEDASYVYFGGNFQNFDNQANADYIVRYNKLTGVYSPLGTGMNASVRALAIGPDGSLYAGGGFTLAGGVAGTAYVAKWNGTVWSPLGTGKNASVRALVFGPDGLLYAGGDFTTGGNYISKWNGYTWTGLGTGMDALVYSLVIGIDGILYAGGNFTTSGGVTTNYIAKWNGTAWSALGSGMDGDVYVVALSPDGILYVGGAFTTAGGSSISYIAKWNGSSWSALGSGTNSVVFSLAIGIDGILYVGGGFTSAGGITLTDRVAKWNGYAWGHLDIDLPGSVVVYSILESKFIDPVIPQKYDFFLGFDTSGTGYFAGKTTITNEGNALAFPQIIFKRTGGTAITVETLKNETTGKELLFDYGLLDGEKLTIDLTPTKKSIVSNYFGSRLDAVLANSDFNTWTLRPGSNDITSFCADNFALYPSSLDAYLLWKDKYKSYN